MKKFYIIAATIFVVFVGSIAFILTASFRDQKYLKTTYSRIAAGCAVTAEADGVKTRLASVNVNALLSPLTVSDMQELLFKPDISDCETVTVTFSDGAVYVVAQEGFTDSGDDISLIIYSCGSVKRCYRVVKYRVYARVSEIVSPGGTYYPNTVIED